MDEVKHPSHVDYHEIIWAPMTEHGKSCEVLPYEYWEIFTDVPEPSEDEATELFCVPGAKHVTIFYRNNSVIVVPIPSAIEGDDEHYAEPIKAIRRLLHIQAQERRVSDGVVEIMNNFDVDLMFQDYNIAMHGANVMCTYSDAPIKLLAKTVVEHSLESAKEVAIDYAPTNLLGPRTVIDALSYEIKDFLDTTETYTVDLIAFGQQGLNETKLAEIVDQKMDQRSCNYDEVVHGMAQQYVHILDVFIDDLICDSLTVRDRNAIEYAEILSPKYYNYETNQLKLKGGELGELYKAIMVSKYYYDWLKHVEVITARTDSYVPYYSGKDFNKHICRWSSAQKGALLSFCARLADKQGEFNDIAADFDMSFPSCDFA